MGFHSLNTPSLFHQDPAPFVFPSWLWCFAVVLLPVMFDSSSVQGVSQCANTGVGRHFFYGIFQTQGLNQLAVNFYHWASDAIPPNINMMHLNPFMFQLKCHPFVNPLSNSVFLSWESDSSTLTAARMKRWYTATWCPSQTFCEAFSELPAPLQWSWIVGKLITQSCQGWNQSVNFPVQKSRGRGSRKNWLFFALPDKCESDWFQMRNKHMRDYSCMNRKFVIVVRDGRFLPIKSNCIYCLSFLVV